MAHDEASKIIFLRIDKQFAEYTTPHTMSYARDAWDEGWAPYPETIYQKVITKLCSNAAN